MAEPKKIPLTIYPNGKRLVIGEAEVQIVDGRVEILSNVYDSDFLKDSALSFMSIGSDLKEAAITTPPHTHKPVQHRDGAPPWCNYCKLTADFTVPTSKLKKEH